MLVGSLKQLDRPLLLEACLHRGFPGQDSRSLSSSLWVSEESSDLKLILVERVEVDLLLIIETSTSGYCSVLLLNSPELIGCVEVDIQVRVVI